ncbi:hypothetical protein ADIS_3927 [Lunatimonas lonarensis]|uniref:Uncharacterized protein n=1 Tax=Lunatimonas lonarensis TaxID=1232681 RepID=R7ZNA6_9BACT|nr:hypothetical protein ADIS_3927 [Lunatimonas lonarensis]
MTNALYRSFFSMKILINPELILTKMAQPENKKNLPTQKI